MLGLVLSSLVCLYAPATCEQYSGSSEPYHVGVWFYPSWNHAALATWGPQHWLPIYGRADTWGGVRDFVERRGAFSVHNPLTGDRIEYSSREPLLGFYDLMERRIVDAEIQMAASEGMEFLSFYWYIDSKTGKEQPISAPTRLFFSSGVRKNIKFVLAPIIGADQPKDVISLETWRGTVVPSLIISLIGSKNTYNDLHYGWKVIGVDGFTCFQPPIEGSPEPYEKYIGEAIPWMKATMAPPNAVPSADLLYMPCGTIGRDSHPWQTNDAAQNAVWTVGTSRSLWREHLRQIRAFVDSGYVNTMKTVFLYAWNEWGESAEQIEPSRRHGYAFADEVREVFDLRSRGPSPTKPP
jgi:hypothetical protein